MPPFVLHSLSLSIFSSVIGPFGGFFASGFKRAFKIKVNISNNVLKFLIYYRIGLINSLSKVMI